MADFIATAFVSIRAELEKGFRTNLRNSIQKSIGSNPISVPIKAQITPFRAQLQAEARKSPILIPVKPDVKVGKFREELKAKVAAAAKGVTIGVPVTVGAARGGTTGGGAAGDTRGGGTGAPKQTAEQKLLADLTAKRAAAQQRLNLALDSGLSPESRLTNVKAAQLKVERALDVAIEEESNARGRLNTALASELGTRQKALITLQEQIAAQRLALEQQVGGAALQKEVNAALTGADALLGRNIQQITKRASLQELNNELLAAEKELKDLSIRADKLEATATKGVVDAKLAEIEARKANIIAQREELKSGVAGGRRRGQAGRGFLATGLGAAGLRGATLAAGGPFLAGAVVAAATFKAAQASANFEKELKTLQVTADATEEQMRAVSAAALRLGADVRLPAVSATDAAVAMTELSKAGLTVEDSIAGAEGVLQLATAAQISNADAAKLAANALNSFGLAGDQAVRVADDFANAANASQGEITDMGIALQQSSAVARQVGLSLEDTIATLSLFAKNGVQGSDAGTSLRTALIRLINPSKKAAAEIRRLGLDLRDAQGNLRPDIFAQFGEATANLAPAARDASAAIIFGQDAIRAVAIGAREGAEGLRLMQYEIDQAGTAAQVASARTTGLAGSISALQSNVQTASLGIGKFISPVLSTLADGLSKDIILAGKLADEIEKLNKRFGDSGGPIDKAKGGIGSFLKTFAKVGIQGVPVSIAEALGAFDKDLSPQEKKVESLTKRLQELQQARLALGKARNFEAAETLTPQIEALKRQIHDLKLEIKGIDPTPVGRLSKAFQELHEARLAGADTSGALKNLLTQMSALKAGGTGTMAPLTTGLNFTSAAADKATAALRATAAAVKGLKRESAVLGAELLKIQSEGGSPASQIAVLQQRIQKNRDIIEEAQAHGNQPGDATKITQARQEIISDLAQIDSLRAGIESDRKQAESDAEDARQAASQAALDKFDANRTRAENRIEIAKATAGLDDDIKTTQFLKRLIKLQISRLKERVKDAKLRNAAFKTLSAELFRLDQELQDLRRQRKAEMEEQVQRSIELDIEFFETTENEAGERRARLRLIKLLEAQRQRILNIRKKRKLTLEEINELKELRNAIAEQKKAIADVTKATKSMFAEMAFNFLTTQQGFAANLLGNLLPMGAIGGTLGNSGPILSGPKAATSGPFQLPREQASGLTMPNPNFKGGKGGPADAVAEANRVATAEGRTGFTASQAAMLISLTSQVVQLLRALNGDSKHPEQKKTTKINNARFDGVK